MPPFFLGAPMAPASPAQNQPFFHRQRETQAMKQYVCLVCGFIYDEALGMPEDGIPAGTLWADVPANWECPDCGVSKADFEMVAV